MLSYQRNEEDEKKKKYVYWFVIFFFNIFSFVICHGNLFVCVYICVCVLCCICFSFVVFGLIWCTGTLVILQTIVNVCLTIIHFCVCSVLINKYYFDLNTKLSEKRRYIRCVSIIIP